ncbi:hypothetical protein FNV43_RR06519 [Rhamnella rubrinervis]|uniref:Uncharacterized protein n=1 Tax=Rhamnella rubrinervis TaxID=2594499 RepID=A0A8K0HE27_9ROSA|nr:hypothetical protein FNV43_RR06519 [Rhamnella rubrinervis]
MLPFYDPNDSEVGMKLLEDLTSNAYQIQQQTLWKEKVSEINHEDVKPYIERIANGEPSHIISSHQITELLTRSAAECTTVCGGAKSVINSLVLEEGHVIAFWHENHCRPVSSKFNQHYQWHQKGIKPYLLWPSCQTSERMKLCQS